MTDDVLMFPADRSVPTARPRAPTARVRPLVEDDLEAVAALFLQRFRKRGGRPGRLAEVAGCMKTLYLDHPTRDGDADALVAVDSAGDIGAFCGGVRTPFQFDGRPASVCVTGTLMASSAPGHALCAVQILRESRKLDYDLIVTDSANRASLAMCQALGYQVVSPESLEWACLFEPASVAAHKLRQRYAAAWLSALTPLARGLDVFVGAALRRAEGGPKRSQWRDEEVDAATFAEIAPRFFSSSRLRPDYSREQWLWLIARAGERRSAGPLRLQIVYDADAEPAAAYAAFGGRGDVARVFHAAAAPHAWGRMLDRIRETARERGCIGAHGSLKAPMLAHAYSVRGMFFYYAGGMLAYSNRADIREAIARGQASLGGFAGDRWTRLASDGFG